MHLVAVTACPTGIAHTYMAAERLEKAARKLGHTIRVETQGAMGIENELTADDLARAAVVVLAAAIPVRGRERFDGLPILEASVQEAIKDAERLISTAIAARANH